MAEKIKEDFSYVCGDMVKEFGKYDKEPEKFFGVYEGEHSVTGKVRWRAIPTFPSKGTSLISLSPRIEVQGGRWLRAILGSRNLL